MLKNINSNSFRKSSIRKDARVILLLKPLLFIALLILLIFQNKAYSNADSLITVFFANGKLSNNEKLILADSLSEYYSISDLQKSIAYDKVIYHYKNIENDEVGMINLLKRISTKQNRICDYESADSSLRSVLFLLEKSSNNKDMGEVNYNLASNYYDWSNYKKALEYFTIAQDYFTKNGNKLGIAKSMKGEAVVVSTWGDYEKSIGLMQNVRDIYLEVQDELGLAGIYLSLGVVMQEWDKLDRALSYFKLSIEYYQKMKMKINEVNLLLHIGDIYLLQKDYKRAMVNYRQAQQLELEVNHKKLRSIALSNLGEAFFYLNQLDSALYYQSKALILKNEVGDNKRTAISYFVIGKIYSKLKQNDSSTYYLNNSLLLAREIGYRDIEIDALKSLSEIYKSMDNLYLAYNYLLEYQELKETTFNNNTNQILEELAIKYEAENSQTENELLKQNNNIQKLQLERERNNKFFIIIFASFIVFLAFIVVFFINNRIKESRKNLYLKSLKNKEITRQKEELGQLNKELEESRERFRGIIDNATIGIYQTNQQGDILFANKNLIKTLEFDSLESLQRINLNSNYHPKREDFLKQMRKHDVITGREDVWKKADGSSMHVMESAWIVKNTDGSIKYIEGLIEDITKRKEAELALFKSRKELKKTNEVLLKKNKQVEKTRLEAEEANKAKSTFLANVSHEIRTPMNSIIGFTELLLSVEKEPKKKSYVRAIDSSSKSLLVLINDILDLSKIQVGKLRLNNEPVSLRNTLNEIEQIFSLQVKSKGIKFITKTNDNLPEYINIDELRIKQILLNIVGNAIKFTNEGYVKVEIKSIINKENISNIGLEIIVSDSGLGISKKDQLYIFKAFSQSENIYSNSHGGTGLGLSITKQLVELMYGELKLTSSVGKGSIFTITIPNVSVIMVKKPTDNEQEIQTVLPKKNEKLILPQLNESIKLGPIDKSVKQEINKHLGLLFEEISTNKVISNINEFAVKIEKIAVSVNNKDLQLLAQKLKHASKKFEVEEIEILLTILKPVFDGK